MKRSLIALALLATTPVVFAQQQPSLESRIRDQLRDTRTQLADLQAQQASWAAEKTQLEKERDAAKADAEAARAQAKKGSAASPETSRALAAETQRREAAETAAQKGKADADASAVALRTAETERARLAKALDAANGQVDACTARNVQMYRVGQEVIAAYENLGVGDVLASRQPFAAKSRAKLENAAQSFGDRLYEQRFDPRAGQASASP
jgi:colicin import membrane protein